MLLAIHMSALFAACAVFAAVWLLSDVGGRFYRRWRGAFEREAEIELAEMFYQMPASTFINYSLGASGGAAVVAFVAFGGMGEEWHWRAGLLFGSFALVGMLLLSRVFLRLLRAQRLERFNDQLEESLMGMSNSLKAGFSIIQAIEMVIKQNKQPISIEFRLMLQQTQLGMAFDEALQNMSERVCSEDFGLVSSAIRTARITGGDLTGVFDRLAVLIRERRRIQRRIRTLTAQGRLQGVVLGLLPMLLMFVLYLMDPALIRNFFTQPLGIVLFVFVLLLEGCGFLVIRKIVTIDI